MNLSKALVDQQMLRTLVYTGNITGYTWPELDIFFTKQRYPYRCLYQVLPRSCNIVLFSRQQIVVRLFSCMVMLLGTVFFLFGCNVAPRSFGVYLAQYNAAIVFLSAAFLGLFMWFMKRPTVMQRFGVRAQQRPVNLNSKRKLMLGDFYRTSSMVSSRLRRADTMTLDPNDLAAHALNRDASGSVRRPLQRMASRRAEHLRREISILSASRMDCESGEMSQNCSALDVTREEHSHGGAGVCAYSSASSWPMDACEVPQRPGEDSAYKSPPPSWQGQGQGQGSPLPLGYAGRGRSQQQAQPHGLSPSTLNNLNTSIGAAASRGAEVYDDDIGMCDTPTTPEDVRVNVHLHSPESTPGYYMDRVGGVAGMGGPPSLNFAALLGSPDEARDQERRASTMIESDGEDDPDDDLHNVMKQQCSRSALYASSLLDMKLRETLPVIERSGQLPVSLSSKPFATALSQRWFQAALVIVIIYFSYLSAVSFASMQAMSQVSMHAQTAPAYLCKVSCQHALLLSCLFILTTSCEYWLAQMSKCMHVYTSGTWRKHLCVTLAFLCRSLLITRTSGSLRMSYATGRCRACRTFRTLGS
jgi:hypothetical protein